MKTTNLHKLIPQAYPKLRRLECPETEYHVSWYFPLVDEVKHMLVKLQYSAVKQDTTPQFIHGFTLLEELDIRHSDSFNKLLLWLHLFEQQFTLKTIYGTLTRTEDVDFFNNYLKLKSEDERIMILNKLSKLESLYSSMIFCPTSMQFITQNLTGLQNFQCSIEESSSRPSSSLGELTNTVCGDFLDFMCLLPSFNLMFPEYKYEDDLDSPSYLPTIFKKVYH